MYFACLLQFNYLYFLQIVKFEEWWKYKSVLIKLYVISIIWLSNV